MWLLSLPSVLSGLPWFLFFALWQHIWCLPLWVTIGLSSWYCLSKHCCCSGCPGNLRKLILGHIIHSHNWHRGAYNAQICISHYFSGKLSRCPCFNCLLSIYSWMSRKAPQSHYFSNNKFLSMSVLCVSYLRQQFHQVSQGRTPGIAHSFIWSQCSRLQPQNLCLHQICIGGRGAAKDNKQSVLKSNGLD